MRSPASKKNTLLLLALPLLTGCLPEDEIITLALSPDTARIAYISTKQGLQVLSIPDARRTSIDSLALTAIPPAWHPGQPLLAYASTAGGSSDVWLATLPDPATTIPISSRLPRNRLQQITKDPARQDWPMLVDDRIYYATSENGAPTLNVAITTSGTDLSDDLVLSLPGGVLYPRISPDGQQVACLTLENLRPRIAIIDLKTTAVSLITTTGAAPPPLISPVSWSPDSRALAWLAADPGSTTTHLCLTSLGQGPRVITVASGRVSNPSFATSQTITYLRDTTLCAINTAAGTAETTLTLELPVNGAASSSGTIALVVAEQFLATTTASLENKELLVADFEQSAMLAEQYYRYGADAKSYNLYEELAASVQRTRDPRMSRFLYLANLHRLGRSRQAAEELEKLLEMNDIPQGVPERMLWRTLGFAYLLNLNDHANARRCFKKYAALTVMARQLEDDPGETDSALNALEILQSPNPALAQLYARAVTARLEATSPLAEQLFGELLVAAPESEAVQQEYLLAPDGYDRTVYYIAPTHRPYNIPPAARIRYLERFLQIAPTSPDAGSVKLDLFVLHTEQENFPRARTLLAGALSSAPLDARLDGVLEAFHNYLETPETQPWLIKAIGAVFLHPDLRPTIEERVTSPDDSLLLYLAAIKLALVENDPDRARREADSALATWNKIEESNRDSYSHQLYGRLLVMRGREAELRGLYSEAAEQYDEAANYLGNSDSGNFEFQEEIRYRAGQLRYLVQTNTQWIPHLNRLDDQAGVSLVNPNWDKVSLQAALDTALKLYDTESGALKAIAAHECGLLFDKLDRQWQARAAFEYATTDGTPTFIRRKAMLELAATDENLNDPWNAARAMARLAGLEGTTQNQRHWASYNIARLHLGIRYNTSQAREALSVIVTANPDTPLGIQAQELLATTGLR